MVLQQGCQAQAAEINDIAVKEHAARVEDLVKASFQTAFDLMAWPSLQRGPQLVSLPWTIGVGARVRGLAGVYLVACSEGAR